MNKTQKTEVNMYNTTVIIPSYNPDVKLSMLVDELIMSGFSDIIVVDDGSDIDIRKVETTFEYIKAKRECTILHHKQNMGKGVALKTGFRYCLDNRSGENIAITADDDGQYTAEQIVECLEHYDEIIKSNEHDGATGKVLRPILLAPRDFRDTSYATRKRMINHIAGFVMKYLCSVNVKDVQTGLRFIPYEYLDKLLEIEGNGFDYEINMLVEFKYRQISYIEKQILIEPIAGQYAKYNPLKDIVKFLSVMIKYAVSSLSATVIDLVAFYIFMLLCQSSMLSWDDSIIILVATILARVISATFNCIVNKKAVFKADVPIRRVIIKFYIFTLFRAILSYGVVYGLAYLLGSYGANFTVVVKLVVDLVLFFIGYDIQKKWVYR